LSGQTPFPKEIAGSQNCDHGFLPLLGDDGLLDLAAPNVENGIRRIALLVDISILLIVGNGSTAVYLREKRFGIERELCFAFHCKPSFRRTHFKTQAILQHRSKKGQSACRSAAHLSKGVLGPAVDIRFGACRQWHKGHFPLRTFGFGPRQPHGIGDEPGLGHPRYFERAPRTSATPPKPDISLHRIN
jgi:hypothetical protein